MTKHTTQREHLYKFASDFLVTEGREHIRPRTAALMLRLAGLTPAWRNLRGVWWTLSHPAPTGLCILILAFAFAGELYGVTSSYSTWDPLADLLSPGGAVVALATLFVLGVHVIEYFVLGPVSACGMQLLAEHRRELPAELRALVQRRVEQGEAVVISDVLASLKRTLPSDRRLRRMAKEQATADALARQKQIWTD